VSAIDRSGRLLRFGRGINDEIPEAHGIVRNRELEHSIEEEPAAARSATVETEDELVEVLGKVIVLDRSLVRAE